MRIVKGILYLVMIASIAMQPLAAHERKKPNNKPTAALAEWSMLVYIAADNSLASYASYNINDMASGMASTAGLNLLVQWDQPRNNKTWRYQITPGKKTDVGSLSSEMGYNPANELVAAMQWIKNTYPAKRYALGLWNHGSGIEDFEPGIARSHLSTGKIGGWLALPGLSRRTLMDQRGILYDDTQNTCLTNQGLTSALTQIKQIIGQNLDLIFMDACLMAMTEVAYQMKDSVNLFVGSQQTIPGNGFPYSKFVKPLSLNPANTTPLQLAQNMVSSYQQYYTLQQPTPDFTLSAIDVTSIRLIKQNIDQFISAVAACNALDATTTKNMIVNARNAALSFEMPEYIDLYSFYAAILGQVRRTSPKSSVILNKQKNDNRIISSANPNYQNALNALSAVIQDGMTKITTVVLKSAAGPVYTATKGISIYYPKDGSLDSSYPLTLFAQDTAWINFIQYYH